MSTERSGALNSSKQLKRRLALAALAVAAVLLSITTATFAWYIFNTSARTTEVKMSAGSSVSLQIASKKDYDEKGETAFGSATQMEPMENGLVGVSTDKIANGFRAVTGFRGEWQGDAYRSIARYFQNAADMKEYYKTTLLLRTTAQSLDVYLADIGSTDRVGQYLSTAMRLGLVVQGQEYIFELNKASNPDRIGDNGSEKAEGYYVLDSTKNDGTVVPFTPLDDSALCNYDPATGAASRKENSVKICTLTGPGGQYSEPVSVDVYLWLEGCDEDCTVDLAGQTMELVSLIFAGL